MKSQQIRIKSTFQSREDRDFGYALLGSLIFYTALVLVLHGVKIQEMPREDFKRIPPHIAKLILEAPKTKPKLQTPGPRVTSIPKVQEAPGPEVTPPAESKKETGPKSEKQDKPAVQEPAPLSPEETRLRLEQEAKAIQQRNREVAMQSGLLRLLTKENKGQAGVKDLTQTKDLEKVLSPVTGLERLQQPASRQESGHDDSLRGSGGSGGIDYLIAMLKEQGGSFGGSGVGSGGGLGERQIARVESPIEIKGADGEGATRSYESIAEVVDSLKGWIRFVYNRALRENPTLKGTITLEFTILPGGEVSTCRVVSSTLNDPALEEQLVRRFLQLKFSSIPEGINTVIYPITLVPTG